MKKRIKVSILFTAIATVSLGIIYPIFLAGIALIMPSSAPPSLLLKPIERGDLFQGRPSVPDSTNSGGTNLSLTSAELAKQVDERLKRLRKDSPESLVPRELLFASASGYDAHISPEGAQFQIPRIAKARNIETGVLEQLVKEHTQPKLWGFIGTEKVNVIELNRTLEKQFSVKPSAAS